MPILTEVTKATLKSPVKDPATIAAIISKAAKGKADPKEIWKLIVVMGSSYSGGWLGFSGTTMLLASLAIPGGELLGAGMLAAGVLLGSNIGETAGETFIEEVFAYLDAIESDDSEVTPDIGEIVWESFWDGLNQISQFVEDTFDWKE